jgi:FixJ family two-component response regulator
MAQTRKGAVDPAGVGVLLVGPRRSPILDELSELLEQSGWATERVAETSDLTRSVSPRHRAVVVVDAQEAERALQVLERLDERRHSTMAIVLVDRAEPGECYCLMQAGAVQFFEVNEDRERILRGVEWAGHVLAP